MPTVQICGCDKPENWVDNAGEIQGNVCKRCGGRIEPIQKQPEPPARASSIGRIIIAVQGAMEQGDFRSDQECHEFASHLVDTMPEALRQKLLTWRANRIKEAQDN